MLPARALAYAIVVSIFILILSLVLIQSSELSRLIQMEQTTQEQLIRNLNSGVSIVLESNQDIRPKTFDLFGEQKDSVSIAKSKWGFFNIGLVNAFINNQIVHDTIQKTFLIGSEKSKLLDFALNITWTNAPLTISGNTLIVGNVAVPQGGIKSASVGGVNYTREKLFYGQQYLSNTAPSVNKTIFSHIANLYNTPSPKSKSIPKSVTRSFAEKTLFIEGDSLFLDNCVITGNIVIKSPKSITVGANCQITDAILIAPSIYFKSGFKGSLQAFAFEQLITESNTSFYYPSVLTLLGYKSLSFKPRLMLLGSHSLLEGLLLFTSETITAQKNYISIDEDAIVHGQVFIDRLGSLELKGKVYGNVTSSAFYRSFAGSLFENVFINGAIDCTKLSPHYISPTFLDGNKKSNLAKWLY
jgi:hypothetical protein